MRWYGLPGVWHICRVFVVWLILTIEIPPIIRVSKLLGARHAGPGFVLFAGVCQPVDDNSEGVELVAAEMLDLFGKCV